MTSNLFSRIADPTEAGALPQRFAAVRRGAREEEKQRLTGELAGQVLSETLASKVGVDAFKSLQKVNPDASLRLKQSLRTENQADIEQFIGTTKIAAQIIEGGGTAEDVSKWLSSQLPLLQQGGSGIAQRLTDAAVALKNPETQQQALQNILISNEAFSPKDPGKRPAEQASFEALIADLSSEDKKRAIRVKAGLDPRAVGSAVQTITRENLIEEIAKAESRIAGAKETGKLKAQFKLTPTIRGAVDLAVGAAKETVDANIKNRSNNLALSVYETAVGSLSNALENTETGPFAGFLPAITANQQIANGAVAAMAPILKDIFRGAGEGTFTEGDQKLLLDLIPTRTTRAAARISQLSSIDAIVRAKLAPVVTDEQPSVAPQAQAAPAAPIGAISTAQIAELRTARPDLTEQQIRDLLR